MTLFNIGPDGFLVLEALLVSTLVAVMAWRRVDAIAGISATAVAAIAIVAFNYRSLNSTPGLNFRIVTALFVIVPSLLLLGLSRQRWLARHAWVLVLLGPVLFVGCYVGICELCVKTGVI
ncbi:MAG TPA: hypothetical protein VN628_09055 [Vicinamibacterales bacterium]|nr:hypothetical protein [Vicinamibacterales bacterium]